MPSLLLPPVRLGRWVENFGARHGGTVLRVVEGALGGEAVDGSTFTVRLPFAAAYDGPAEVTALVAAVEPPRAWGVLLVRKGGFAVARIESGAVVEHKIGQRHVQGRTKAGGQSQQRFARRRDNQARQAYEAAADHAARILAGVPVGVVGGDRPAVEEVLADRRLAGLDVVEPWLPVPDPKRAVLDQAVLDAASLAIEVVNA
ncbi:acVLRF1 family peptidyl-tRNA hydrolase [uncultured Nocardioides sp.]|uniref:acVLRF1 family peptidyl-tRNA hydrolase n=1 Tax=uncultured Nocardioides sp. TaxID=198441 RepID=UPI0025F4EC56|nr:acVLRF1 family peptidyl-tRNA hydrolase [uncultured Nocardioides sp.]